MDARFRQKIMLLFSLLCLGWVQETSGFKVEVVQQTLGQGTSVREYEFSQNGFIEKHTTYTKYGAFSEENGVTSQNGMYTEWHEQHFEADMAPGSMQGFASGLSMFQQIIGAVQAFAAPIPVKRPAALQPVNQDKQEDACNGDAHQLCTEQLHARDLVGTLQCIYDAAQTYGRVSEKCAQEVDSLAIYQCINDAAALCPDLQNSRDELSGEDVAQCLVPRVSELSEGCAGHIQYLKKLIHAGVEVSSIDDVAAEQDQQDVEDDIEEDRIEDKLEDVGDVVVDDGTSEQVKPQPAQAVFQAVKASEAAMETYISLIKEQPTWMLVTFGAAILLLMVALCVACRTSKPHVDHLLEFKAPFVAADPSIHPSIYPLVPSDAANNHGQVIDEMA